MEDEWRAEVKDTKKKKKLTFTGSTNERLSSNWSPEYIHSRKRTHTRGTILDDKGVAITRKVSRQLFPTNITETAHVRDDKPVDILLNKRWPIGCYSDDECNRLADINDDRHLLEGYTFENEKETFYTFTANQSDCQDVGDTFVFDHSEQYKLIFYIGQKFKHVTSFRQALKVSAIHEGFNLCVMENRTDVVSCECSHLCCDWQIKAARVVNGNTFVITDFPPQHKCPRRGPIFQPRSKWISAMFLHRWKQEPTISTIALTHEIEATFDCKCPEWKVLCAANRAKQLLGIDHEDGYAMVNQFKQEMETIDRNNIVLVDTKILPSDGGERFKRMFVCYERASYAFKVHCRRLLAVDGWKMNNPYNNVMLVTAALDGNNGIFPVAFCEVEVEDLDSWVYFLKNINNALRLESGTGLCILADGDNDVEYAVEEYLAHATYRQCCHRIFTEMVNRFPKAVVHHLFWAACRSTSASAFFKYMELICVQSKECHDWLEKSNWKRWGLFCVPEWVKCTCITLTITEKLRNYCQPYLEMNIARKFEAIARLTSELFEQRRMVVWNWNWEKVPTKVRDVINNRCIDGKQLNVVQDHGTLLKVTDSLSSSYDLNMEAMTCTCGLWQISGIPCPHACIGIHYINGNVEDYVDELLSVQNFLSTYAPGMMQLPKENAWKWHSGHNLHPPMTVVLQPLTLQPPNDITSNKDLQHMLHHYYSTTDNLQVNVFLTLIVCCFP